MSEAEELRVWLVIRRDLDMSAGKLAAQVGHAMTSLIFDNPDDGLWRAYMADNQPKIAIAAKNEAALTRAVDEARAAGVYTSIIRDAGRTEFAEPTLTVAAIGPCVRSDLPPYVRGLQLYKSSPDATT